jgi:hypothetical protein
MFEESYLEWSARAISELAALSNFPTETIYSRFGVVIVEGMTYVESLWYGVYKGIYRG